MRNVEKAFVADNRNSVNGHSLNGRKQKIVFKLRAKVANRGLKLYNGVMARVC